MNYDFYHSPLGLLYLEATDTGLSRIEMVDYDQLHNARPCIVTQQTISQLNEYFDHKRKEFDIPIDFSSGTEFQQKVWGTLLNIPYGKTTTYQAIADQIKNPLSVRAVGAANGRNPIPIVVPCHRVIGSNGSLVGYALGIDIKKKLLRHENPEEFGEQGTLF